MKYRFGILIDSYGLKLWQFNSIKALLDEGHEIDLVVMNHVKNKFSIHINTFFFFLFKALFGKSKQQTVKDIRELIKDCHVIKCSVEKKGKFSEYFAQDDIAKIKAIELDFMLRFGFGIIRGEILNAAKFGVWSFHHGDEQKYRGGPYCFWEIYNNEPNTCAILQRLTNKLDGGVVLKKGHFKTVTHSFAKNINQALELSSPWPAQFCREMSQKTFTFPVSDSKTEAKIYLLPSNLKMLVFVCKIINNKIKNIYRTYLTYDAWHVGYINRGVDVVSKNPIRNTDITWLKQTSRSYFMADPFLFFKTGQWLLALEYLSYRGFKGEIKTYSGSQFDVEEKEYAICENYHLSYPNVFNLGDKTYCLPEAYESGTLYIYEKTNDAWQKHPIIDNIKCIDPEIIFHEGYYYLFTTIKGDTHDTKLFIYYSKELLKGWQPHLLNPVVTDVRSARGAGKIYTKDNMLYRPGQNYSIHKEGSITISRINKISPTDYKEEIVSYIEPIKNSEYPDKIHTINGNENITVIDACKIRSLVFRPDILYHIVKSKI
ncbi:MAG: hypothetical protein WBM13_03855 [Bacteroidia bacterium]